MSGSRWMGVQRGLRGGRDSRLLPGYLLRSSSNDTPVLSTDVRLTLDGCAERTARGSVTHPHFSSQAIWRRLSMATPRRSAPCCTACGMSWTFKLPFASKFKIYLAVNQVSYASKFKIPKRNRPTATRSVTQQAPPSSPQPHTSGTNTAVTPPCVPILE